MWEDWKKAWQQAVDNFERELKSEDDPASPGERASAMRRDLNAARNALRRLEADLAHAQKDLAGEEASEQTARRRAEMAERIGDADTARIAREFATRHAARAEILRRKVEVLSDELGMRTEELAVMEQQAVAEIDEDTPSNVEKILEREKDDFDFRRMERLRKEKEAEARLEELKKKMQ